MLKLRLNLWSLVLSLCLISCQEGFFDEKPASEESSMEAFNEKFSEDNPSGNTSTRTSISGTSLSWSSSDSYGLWNGSTLYQYKNTSGNSFATTTPVKKADSYILYYPYSGIKSVSEDKVSVTIPSTQTYADGSFGDSEFPMVGSTTDLSTAKFKNLMGLWEIHLKTQTDQGTIKVSNIKVTSDKPLAGEATVSASDYSIDFTDPVYSINIEVPNVELSSEQEAVFYIPLPPETHNLTLEVNSSSEDKLVSKYASYNIKRSVKTTQNIVKDFTLNSNVEYVILLNEGNWQSDNGQVSLIYNGTITNEWFRACNGIKIGDTPQDILYINDNLVAISVNWSNIVYYITPQGKLLAQTENVPNCRSLATDGNYLYITSYAHETALGETYTGGYVAKIDLNTKAVVATCEVGYEPEGIAYYDGKLYIANTGGYAFSENHSYEYTVSVVDASTMKKLQDVEIYKDSGESVINLYGEMSQSGQYLCINSPGDYQDITPSTVIFNCEDNTYKVYDFASTYNTVTTDGKFFTLGSYFTYNTGEYIFCMNTIDPVTGEVTEGYLDSNGNPCSQVQEVFENIQPYCVYINPYSGHLYMTDAKSYATAGTVYEFSRDGKKLNEMTCYINPGHMCAMPASAIKK